MNLIACHIATYKETCRAQLLNPFEYNLCACTHFPKSKLDNLRYLKLVGTGCSLCQYGCEQQWHGILR